MSKSTSYSHHCNIPDCKSFGSPRFLPLNNKTACLTVVRGNKSEQFAYYSQKKNILAPFKAPKPLLLVPESAVAAGFEPDNGEIRLNKATKQGGSSPAQKRNRRGEKIAPSKLRFEVMAGDVEVPSSPATEELSEALREVDFTTSSTSSADATEGAKATSSASSATTTTNPWDPPKSKEKKNTRKEKSQNLLLRLLLPPPLPSPTFLLRTLILGNRPGSKRMEILMILEGFSRGPSLIRMLNEEGEKVSGK